MNDRSTVERLRSLPAEPLLAPLDQADAAEARIKAVEDVLAAWHVEPGESGLADDLLRALDGDA